FPVGAVRETGSLHYSGSVDSEAYQETVADGASLVSPLDVELDLTARGTEVDCRGEVRGTWTLQCSRCLAQPEQAFRAPLEATLPAEGAVVDASDELRQAIALAMPYRFICKPDCKGLCPRCKKNLNLEDCKCEKGEFHA